MAMPEWAKAHSGSDGSDVLSSFLGISAVNNTGAKQTSEPFQYRQVCQFVCRHPSVVVVKFIPCFHLYAHLSR